MRADLLARLGVAVAAGVAAFVFGIVLAVFLHKTQRGDPPPH